MSKIPLNLVYLKYFSDAVREGSISAASRHNHVSQSAISQGISKLEAATGLKLLDHCPNRFKTTHAGKMLFENGKNIFQAMRKAEEFLSEPEKGEIEFACTHSFALALLPYYLKKAQEIYPRMQINFRVAHPSLIAEWVKKEVIDFGIVPDTHHYSSFRYEELLSFDCELIYKGQYQLYVSTQCNDSSQLEFLLGEESKETDALKKGYAKRFGKELPVKMRIASWQAIATLTEEGFGAGFLPDYVVHGDNHRLKPYPVEIVKTFYSLLAVFPKNRYRSPLVTLFLKLMQSLL